MSHDEIPSGDGVRERVLVEVNALREQYLAAHEGDGILTWWGAQYWIDRVRRLVLHRGKAKRLGFEGMTTVPDAQLDEIEFDGCRHAISGVWELIDLLAVFVGGKGGRPAGATDFLNLAVVQPLLNPAFDALFWLGLAWQMRPNRTERNLGEAIGAMAFDLTTYPASQVEGPQIRKAQVEWVKSVYEPDLDSSAWLRSNDQDWAAHCKELMHARRLAVDNVFFEIAHKARRMTDGD